MEPTPRNRPTQRTQPSSREKRGSPKGRQGRGARNRQPDRRRGGRGRGRRPGRGGRAGDRLAKWRSLASLGQHSGSSIRDVTHIVQEGAHPSEDGPRILTLQNHVDFW